MAGSSQPSRARIRTATAADWMTVLRIEADRYLPDERLTPYFVRMAPLLFGRTFTVAERDDVDGYCLAGLEQAVSERAWVLSLAVNRSAEGCGLGRALIDDCLVRLGECRVREVLLTVAPVNTRALTLYEHVGFQATRLHKDFLGLGQDRLELCLKLHPPRG